MDESKLCFDYDALVRIDDDGTLYIDTDLFDDHEIKDVVVTNVTGEKKQCHYGLCFNKGYETGYKAGLARAKVIFEGYLYKARREISKEFLFTSKKPTMVIDEHVGVVHRFFSKEDISDEQTDKSE